MIQVVEVSLTAVAIPNGARVLEPVVPGPARFMVSVVIAIVIVAPDPAINVTAEPIGNATDEFAGMVTVLVDEA